MEGFRGWSRWNENGGGVVWGLVESSRMGWVVNVRICFDVMYWVINYLQANPESLFRKIGPTSFVHI
jgi:hypothetical protein